MSKKEKLIFVYNAEKGLINQSIDFLHKMVKPETYECKLCQTTYGNFAMKKKWKKFVQGLNIDVEFKYKNQLNKNESEAAKNKFPVVLMKREGELKMFMEMEKMNKLKNEDEIIDKLSQKLNLQL